jgi:BarA-like signal transduction histidine kinase
MGIHMRVFLIRMQERCFKFGPKQVVLALPVGRTVPSPQLKGMAAKLSLAPLSYATLIPTLISHFESESLKVQ